MVVPAAFPHRHKVDDLAHAVRRQETRYQHIGLRPIHLLVGNLLLAAGRGNLEMAALGIVQDGGENTGRVKVRAAEPVDGAVDAHQSHGVHIADDAVILDGQVSH